MRATGSRTAVAGVARSYMRFSRQREIGKRQGQARQQYVAELTATGAMALATFAVTKVARSEASETAPQSHIDDMPIP